MNAFLSLYHQLLSSKIQFEFIEMFSFQSPNRYNGAHRHHWLLILFGISIGFVVFTFAENWLQLEEILYQPAVSVDQWIPRWTLHIRIILDILVWNGSCLLNV